MTSFEMKSFDELFGIDDTDSSSLEIPLDKIDTFNNHPFKVLDNDDMEQLVESIKINGIINPAIVREKAFGRYELISGHRRKRACELAGLKTLKCQVAELTDDEATIFMVDSNLHRSNILPSEKAYSYKMRLEAIKCQKENGELLKGKSKDILSEEVGESREQIRRYIRLTELIPDLLDLVDSGKIKIRPAVELSYISENLQMTIFEYSENNNTYPSQKQATELKDLYLEQNLNEEAIIAVLAKKPKKKKSSDESEHEIGTESETEIKSDTQKASKENAEIKIPYSTVKRFFPNYTYEQVCNEIIKLIENAMS